MHVWMCVEFLFASIWARDALRMRCVCACGAQHVWLGCNFQLLMRLSWVELGSAPVWHVTGARRAKGHGEAEPTMQTFKPQCPRALQPHGKCENGLRSGPYVLAAARWPWQIVQ